MHCASLRARFARPEMGGPGPSRRSLAQQPGRGVNWHWQPEGRGPTAALSESFGLREAAFAPGSFICVALPVRGAPTRSPPIRVRLAKQPPQAVQAASSGCPSRSSTWRSCHRRHGATSDTLPVRYRTSDIPCPGSPNVALARWPGGHWQARGGHLHSHCQWQAWARVLLRAQYRTWRSHCGGEGTRSKSARGVPLDRDG
jgi:hypothetical protein